MIESKGNWDGILRGGPFLEVSFLLEMAGKMRVAFVEQFLCTLRSLPIPITFVHPACHPSIMAHFQEGYPYDADDPASKIIYQAEFPLIVQCPEERKSRLYISEVAPQTLQFDFAFYGAHCDAPEWHQRGIIPGDEVKFLAFFGELYRVYKFPLGIIGYEVDCLTLFPANQPNQSEVFQVVRFDPATVPDHPEVDVILWQGRYLKNTIDPSKEKP